MFRFVKLFGLILVLVVASSASSESLWKSSSAGMFADQKARQVGDLLTIVIVESMASSSSASTDFDKDLEHSNAAGVGPILRLIPDIAYSAAQSSSASGQTTLANKLVGKLTATVKKVCPNGNLEIGAERSVVTNDETQTVTLTGIVRPQDISTDNTVLSTFLSDAQIKYTGKGPIGDRQKEGFISKLLKFLF